MRDKLSLRNILKISISNLKAFNELGDWEDNVNIYKFDNLTREQLKESKRSYL